MIVPLASYAVAGAGDRWAVVPLGGATEPASVVGTPELRSREEAEHPRWVWWDQTTARDIVSAGIRPMRCWDLSAVHRLLWGGGRSDAGRTWASAHGLGHEGLPSQEQPTLFSPADEHDPAQVVRDDGHLAAEWVGGRWRTDDCTLRAWAELAAVAQELQRHQIIERVGSERPAHTESAAGLICAEMEHDGLPVDLAAAERVVAGFLGPRPRDAADELARVRERDEMVLAHLPPGADVDLRNPAQVRSMLRRAGIEVPDTRARRLEEMRNDHPIVDALLRWRKAERIATTFGYRWLDEHVDGDGRLRGRWTPSDGAAGRMTATAGLHNLPAVLRPAIAAEPGYLLVRADLGQIEPRVLAVVSGDPALIRATQDDDLYAPVARRLGVEREIAKVAVLGAMYGQTTGHGAAALAGLEREYPTAMGFLQAADEAAQGGHDLFTVSGRRIQMSGAVEVGASDETTRSRAAARGRYGRNAVVQGAAAEFFKTWAALVRAKVQVTWNADIVLCLHDELLVHSPEGAADHVAAEVGSSLGGIASQWGPAAAADVRFTADVSVIRSWDEAK